LWYLRFVNTNLHARMAALALAVASGCGGRDSQPAAAPSNLEASPLARGDAAAADESPKLAPALPSVTLEATDDDGFYVRPRAELHDQVRLPKSAAYEVMVDGAPVVIGKTHVFADGDIAAAIIEGAVAQADVRDHVITQLLPPLQAWADRLESRAQARGELSMGTLVVFADADTTMAPLIDVMVTANRAKFRAYQIAVDVGVPDLSVGTVLELSPPKFTTSGAVFGPTEDELLHASIDRDHVALWTEGAEKVRFAFDHRTPDSAHRLTALARELAATRTIGKPRFAGEIRFPTVSFSAELDVTVERMIAVLSAVAGPDCSMARMVAGDREACLFPKRIIVAH
jgi:hypothetical protein